jgi:tetratricopeptide (TPR) repeat protein
VAPQWQERYRYSQETQAKLAALEEKAAVEPLTEEEALNRARWTAEFRDNAEAIPLFQEFLQEHPEHAVAHFALGEILLEEKDEQGLRHLEQAMAAESDAVIAACQRAYAFLKEQGRDEEAEAYRRRAEEQYERLVRAQQERAGVSDRDRFEPHGLPADVVEKLRQQLSRFETVGAVYLVRKVVTLFPEKPSYVLAVAPHSPWYRFRSEGDEAKLSARLAQELEFPGEANLVVLNQHKARLKKALRKVPGAEVYRR